MKTKHIIFSALSVLLLASCGSDEANNADNPVAVQLSAGIDTGNTSVTKVSGTSWEAGDQVGVFMVKHGTTDIAESAANRLYQWTSGSTFAANAGNTIYYPMDNSAVDFIGYYPYKAGTTALGDYAVDVSSQTNLSATDLLYAKSTAGYTKMQGLAGTKVALAFGHQLTSLVIKIEKGDGTTDADLAATTVKIEGMNTKTTFNLADGTLGTPSDISDISLPGSGTSHNAIIVPAGYAAGAVKVYFTTAAGETFTWNISPQDALTFKADTEYIYTVKINRIGVGDVDCTIKPWGSNETGSGAAT